MRPVELTEAGIEFRLAGWCIGFHGIESLTGALCSDKRLRDIGQL
jgi:hypothetical protein